jgi:rhodanese-related sulfurtransferase
VEEARVRLARVGIEDLRGHLAGGLEGWRKAGLPLSRTPQLGVNELRARLAEREVRILDVRRQAEWDAGHIAGAQWWALDRFSASLPPVEKDVPLAVHCKGGYRSMIACSLLERAGYKNVVNVTGGFDAWQQADLPFEASVAVKA